jgi:hypothetical protein
MQIPKAFVGIVLCKRRAQMAATNAKQLETLVGMLCQPLDQPRRQRQHHHHQLAKVYQTSMLGMASAVLIKMDRKIISGAPQTRRRKAIMLSRFAQSV